MSSTPPIEQLMDLYLSGKATPGDEVALRSLIQADPGLVRRLYSRALLDQDLAVALQSPAFAVPSRDASPAPRRWIWKTALGAAALALIAVAGYVLWPSGPALAPTDIARIVGIDGLPEAVILRETQELPVATGSVLRVGDQLYLRGPCAIRVEALAGDVHMALNNHACLLVASPVTYALRKGRIEATVDPRPSRGPIQFLTPSAGTELAGARFVLRSSDQRTHLRVVEGKAAVKPNNDRPALSLSAGECVMARNDRSPVYRDTYAPGKAVEGAVLFADDFESGLGRWTSTLTDDRRYPIRPSTNAPTYATLAAGVRDGRDNHHLRLKAPGRQPEGWLAMLPSTPPLEDGFVCELDILYDKNPADLGYCSYFYYGHEPVYTNPGRRHAFLRLASARAWGRIRIDYVVAPRGPRRWMHHTRFSLDGVLMDEWSMQSERAPLVSLKPREGTVLVDNVVVRELITFD